jgi:hypothetical protein
MRKLELDFQRQPAPSAAGWLLLATGIAAVAGVLLAGQHMEREAGIQTERLAHLRLAGWEDAQPRTVAPDPALDAARRLLDRSRLPWRQLFAALESADGADVALLAVAPDVSRGQVKLHAEARNLAAMLAFHRLLQQDSRLGQVVLTDHAVATDSPEKPVRFHVLATWGSHHVGP